MVGQHNGPSKQTYYPNKKRVDRGRGFKRISDLTVEVYDIDMAAWLLMNRVNIVNACKDGREAVVTFQDPLEDDRIAKLSIDWLNSEAAKFANAVRSIKKICFSTGRQRGQR